MYVRNRMATRLITVNPETALDEALQIMSKQKVKRLPVLKNDKLVGIITEKKISDVTPSPVTSITMFDVKNLLSRTKVEAVMEKNVITVSPATLLEEAAIKMRDNRIGSLPVLDEEKLVGIITETDIFDAFIEIMGFRDMGSRISVEVEEDKPGVLAQVAGIIAAEGLNITHLAVYRNELIIRLNTLSIQNVANGLRDNGFKVISIIKSEQII